MSLIEELSEKSINDEYFRELFSKAELLSAYNYFHIKANNLKEKELLDLLRFADILSRSRNADAQNKAYKIISLLVGNYKDDSVFRAFANSVLTKLGNFPALKFLEVDGYSDENPSLELVFEKYTKEIFQKIPGSSLVFTDSQYKIFESLKNSNHYSFSGPTSLGKSFILNSFIRHLIEVQKVNENIVILVPTRALINQTLLQLKKEFSNIKEYRILSHPTVPESFRFEGTRYIFIFTPERLVAYLADTSNPKVGYLFVDEAQKVVAEKDSRSPLYYHAILQAERKSIKLYFASPNIPNPDVFLSLFDKSTEESINIKSSPVAQNRYFLDLLEQHCRLLSDLGDEKDIPVNFSNRNFSDWLKLLSDNQSSLIYCNTKTDTIQYALSVSASLPYKNDERIDEVVSVIKEHLHEKYYLVDCLRKGVAFHFGNLPQRIREKVEILFAEKAIDYVFCTSTLLEGVNLPAKNIFILSNAIGLSKFTDVDFWNLAGRAGRLTKELSGNIICTRIEYKNNRWKNPEKDLTVVKNKSISPISPSIINGKKKFFENVEAALTESDFTRKHTTDDERKVWSHYANIALIHEIRQEDSTLRSNFISKKGGSEKVLRDMSLQNEVPEKILSSYSIIKAKYQNKIIRYNRLEELTLSSDVSYKSVLQALETLCDFYSWDKEEVGGRNPMYRSRESLKYYAVLMSNWMDSTPLSRMISTAIDYYTKNGHIWDVDQLIDFNPKDKYQINLVINEIISNIDNILRFKLKNYFGNYYELLAEKLGEASAGKNWAEYLEYGTTDYRIIELQNIGIPRHLASYLLKNYHQYFKFYQGVLVEVEKGNLFKVMDQSAVEFKELLEVI
ncbi:DEAD/DEAH box helicase [Reinekea thalattae]|uniref:DEAD/DEAH box helicase n=1 Tax=Reinekea thalattae TaxID=2593301 RepID=A0A5C8Z6X1_9GAMM|nr:DEAD/DEAH box helicase [Reinekea thalattae]TXR53845.1 DEAD/DEAH box helicase [Reinekea thalattae]